MLAAASSPSPHIENDNATKKRGSIADNEPLIPLSCNKIRRLWATKTRPAHPESHTDHWSDWRRIHQTRARRSHYQRQRTKHHTLPLQY
jgi:hypothetical protein